MNYLKLYIKICRIGVNRLKNEVDGAYEKHHVFPTSIYGKNDFISLLTYKEHFLVHHLLIRIFKNRYGLNDKRTQQMCFAIHKMVYRWDKTKKYIVWSRHYQIARNAVRMARIGVERPDMRGKRFFGASEEKIKAGMEKMAKSKIGKSVNYPSSRKSRGNQTEETRNKIKETKKQTNQKYILMSEDEFINWIAIKKKFTIDGRKNGNIVRAINARGEKIEKYYGHSETK
jgi:hypothetical protein